MASYFGDFRGRLSKYQANRKALCLVRFWGSGAAVGNLFGGGTRNVRVASFGQSLLAFCFIGGNLAGKRVNLLSKG